MNGQAQESPSAHGKARRTLEAGRQRRLPELSHVPDVRGAGWSDAPRNGYRTNDLVEDLQALLDALDLDNVAVVGHDRGAALAFQLALRDPDRVTHIVGMNELHPYNDARRVARNAWRYLWTPFVETPLVGRFVLAHMPSFTRTWLRLGVTDRASMPAAAVAAYVDVLRRPNVARAAEQLMYQFAYHEFIPMLRHPETLNRCRSVRVDRWRRQPLRGVEGVTCADKCAF